MNRAKRRHHRFRVREKARGILKWLWGEDYQGGNAILDPLDFNVHHTADFVKMANLQ